jgi:hypothetical protein
MALFSSWLIYFMALFSSWLIYFMAIFHGTLFEVADLWSNGMDGIAEEAVEAAELEAIEYLLRDTTTENDEPAAPDDPYWACSQKVADLCVPQVPHSYSGE